MQKWGRWSYDDEDFILWLRKGKPSEYYIELSKCTNAAVMLDWIMQLAAKKTTTVEDLGNLVQAFLAIFHPQTTMCSGAMLGAKAPERVNPREIASRVAAARKAATKQADSQSVSPARRGKSQR